MPERTTPKKMSLQDMNTQQVLGAMAAYSFQTFIGQYVHSLPKYTDDIERDFGMETYERMLNDSALGSSLIQIKISVLSDGIRFLSPVSAPASFKDDPDGKALYDKCEEYRQFIEQMCGRLQQPLEDILDELLDALVFGHVVAEQTYAPEGGRLILKCLRVKPRTAYAFVVDKFMELQGLISTGNVGEVASPPLVSSENVIPREKFLIFTHSGKGGDPRGRSILRMAYNPWYLKQQVWPQYLKYLAQFGTPSVAGILPPNPADVELADSAGSVIVDQESGSASTMSAADAMLAKLIAFANGTAIVLENGSSIEPIEVQGDGSAYTNAIDTFDRQMVRAVIIAVRATMEAEHSSKADSQTAQDTVGEYTQFIRRRLEAAFYRDVIVPAIRYNFGDEAASPEFCPFLSLSSTDGENVIELANAVANLARAGYLHVSQKEGIDAMLGFPKRDIEAELLDMEEEKEASRAAAQQIGLGMSPIDEEEEDILPGKKPSKQPGKKPAAEE